MAQRRSGEEPKDKDPQAYKNPFFDAYEADAPHASLMGDPAKGLDELRSNLSAVLKSKLNLGDFRPLNMMFGIGEPKPFSFPSTPEAVWPRIVDNTRFFMLNYIVVAATIGCLSIITSPYSLFSVLLVVVGWLFARDFALRLATQRGPALVVQGLTITPKLVFYVMSGVSGVLLLTALWNVLFSTIGISAVLVLAHAITKEPLTKHTPEEYVDESGSV